MLIRDGKIATGLHIVATPIGAARDITLRSLDILAGADLLAAEDTRNTRRLMDIHGIKLGDRRLLAYHDHNGVKVRPQIIEALQCGASVAYVSDAGTPMVADPGFDLSRAVIAEGLPVFSAPGASAVLAALCVSGQPTDRFFFAGFAWCLVLPIWQFPFDLFTSAIPLAGALEGNSTPGWVLIAYVVLIGTILPYLCVMAALKNLKASTTSTFGLLEPIFAGIVAWIWFAESWTAIQLVGGVVVIAGIYMADQARSRTT